MFSRNSRAAAITVTGLLVFSLFFLGGVSAQASGWLYMYQTGFGDGTITNVPTGINNSTDCSTFFTPCEQEYYSGSDAVTLTAAPAAGFVFTGWSDACTGLGTCDITMDASKNVYGNIVYATQFQSFGPSFTAGSLDQVKLGDLDGDGDLDAFAITGAANKVWLNDGAGTFTDTGQALGTSNSYGFDLGDLDGDGDLDAVVANVTGGSRSWINDGTGTFSVGVSIATTNANSVALGDIDGDGDLDAWIAEYSFTDRIYANDGDGNFTQTTQAGVGVANSKEVVLADLDGDTDLDAYIGTNATHIVYMNNGTGTFTVSGTAAGSGNCLEIDSGDVDGDNDIDILTGGGGGEPYRTWINNGSGVFSSGTTLSSYTAQFALLADLDGDGDPDSMGTYGEFFVNNGSGAFTMRQDIDSAGRNIMSVDAGDLDGDGDVDLFVTWQSGAEPAVWLNKVGELVQYTLTVTKNGTGTGTVTPDSGALNWVGSTGTGAYSAGTDVILTAAADASSTFTGWSGEGCSGTGTCQVALDQARNVTATFTIRSYTVTASAGSNGSLDGGTPSPATVNHGSTTQFTFNAAANHHVASVSGCGISYTNTSNAVTSRTETTAAVTGTCTVTAAFAINQYSVTATPGANGSLDAGTPSPATVNHGSTTQFTFNADTGFHVSSVSGCGISYTNSANAVASRTETTAAVTGTCTVTAAFATNQYTVTATAGANGSLDGGTPSPATVDHGLTAQFTFNADTGYHVASVSGCGISYSNTDMAVTSRTETTAAATGDCAVAAAFAPNTWTLTVALAGTGSGTVTSSPAGIDCGSDCTEAYLPATAVTLTAAADVYSIFSGWSGDADCADGSVTMDSAVSCTATFDLNPIDVADNDWDGDGRADIIWRNHTLGANLLTCLDSPKSLRKVMLDREADSQWDIRAIADFDDDGYLDLFWHHQGTGETRFWLMQTGTLLGTANFRKVPTDWQIVGAEDFDRDGQADLLARSTVSGVLLIGYMDGTTLTGKEKVSPSRDTTWSVAGIGDFNGDGYMDIAWRGAGGAEVWYMQGAAKTGEASLPTVPAEWVIEQVSDFDNDGDPDLLYRNYGTGQNGILYLDDNARTGHAMLPTLTDTNWHPEE